MGHSYHSYEEQRLYNQYDNSEIYMEETTLEGPNDVEHLYRPFYFI